MRQPGESSSARSEEYSPGTYTVGQLGAEGVAVEGLIGQKSGKVDLGEKRSNTDAIMALARQQDKAHEIAERIDQSDDLGRQTAAGTPNGLSLRPPFAPVPC